MLHHIDVNWPTNIPREFTNVTAMPTRHALERSREKNIQLSARYTGTAFECEVVNGKLVKIALRCKYSNTHDLCVVISPRGLLITCWLNAVDDNHRTLNRSKYSA